MGKLQHVILAGVLLWRLPAFADEAAAVFHSPKNQFDIRFKPQPERLYPTPNERPLKPGTKSQIYSVSFYLAGQDSPEAMTYFTDIQSSPDEHFPKPLADLVKQMLWSPNEDFVVLPAEAWPTQNGEVIPSQAVSLRQSSVWQFVNFPLDKKGLVWLDPLQVIGNVVTGCRHEVKEFDAGNGRTSTYQAADPPEGYDILSSQDNRVVLKKVLGDCATDADRAKFHADCVIMNVSFGRREIGSCPP